MTTTSRGPGRPRKDDSPRREGERRRRKAGAAAVGNLGVDEQLLDHAKYQYRWINDTQNGRIVSLTKRDDWDLVPNGGEKEDSTDLGDMISVIVGSHKDGSPMRAYLARKPREFYEADKAAEQAELDRQLTELRRGRSRDGSSQSDYIPHSGIRVDG